METPTRHRALALVLTTVGAIGLSHFDWKPTRDAATPPSEFVRSDAGEPTRASHATAPRFVDPNQATAAALQTLPGIGPTLAERIVAERSDHGAFRSVRELRRVRGIGERVLTRIQPWLVIAADAGATDPPSSEARSTR